MKRFIAIFLLLTMTALLFAGCAGGSPAAPETEQPAPEGLRVVTTIFPLYDWVRTLQDGRGSVSMLLKNGVDLHNYQPSAADLADIANCDLFLYVGGESDEWVEDLLAADPGHSYRAMSLLEALEDRLLDEELVEGMEDPEAEQEEGGPELDEHVWLSLRNAQAAVEAIGSVLAELDADNQSGYAANAAAYGRKLAALDGDYQTVRSAAIYDTLLVADRFPFRYLAEDYNLKYYAAFPGCAAASDVSFETVAFLAEKLKELDLPVLLIIDGSDGEIAQTVLEAAGTGAEIRTLHSCQCVSEQELAQGITYLQIMSDDLSVLKEALGVK